jgi:hypothetical protein
MHARRGVDLLAAPVKNSLGDKQLRSSDDGANIGVRPGW